MVENPRTCDCRMKPILRQEQLTHPRDLKSLSNSAWVEGPLAGRSGWYRMRGIRNPLSISRIRGDSETLLGAYGYVIGGSWSRQQMAAGQNSWRHRRHGNQSQPPDVPWTGRKFW